MEELGNRVYVWEAMDWEMRLGMFLRLVAGCAVLKLLAVIFSAYGCQFVGVVLGVAAVVRAVVIESRVVASKQW